MIDDAFTYPTNRDDWLTTVLIGGVLTFLSFLILPMFPVYGYLLRVIRGTIDGDDQPPAFDEWGDLFVEGLQAWLIGLAYMVIPLVVGGVLVGGSLVAMVTGGRAGAGVGAAGFLVGFLLTTVLALVFGYLAVAGIVRFAEAERIGAAFDVDGVRSLATDADFAVAWVVSLVGILVAGVIAGIPLVGWLAAPFAYFYAIAVAGRLWGGGTLEATDGDATESGPRSGDPTASTSDR
jgi:hypothetical protein